jgi:hypothetical protein
VSHGRKPLGARHTRKSRSTLRAVLLWVFVALSLAYGVFLIVLGLSR